MKAKTIILIILAGLGVIILVQNSQVATIRLFFWEIAMSQVILVPLVFIIGFVAGFLAAKLGRRRKKDSLHGHRGENLPAPPSQFPPRS